MSGNDPEETRDSKPTFATETTAGQGLSEERTLMIGSYRIVRKIGQGGMGVVYEAEQQHPRRPVAVKVIRGAYVDEHQVRLFQREAEALARLRHPGIAAIYEAGRTAEGQHFFAMELVRGVPLTEYVFARGRQGNHDQATLEESLRLFCKICDAVNYAHQRGVIHRDLKPSNILVCPDHPDTSTGGSSRVPELKILDFGLARITDGDVAVTTMQTHVGQLQGTLPYMSPEQARGSSDEIDLRTDVYSLGVILYEMTTGQFPYDLRQVLPHEAIRIICEETPKPPSRAWKELATRKTAKFDTDLVTIILKALEKQPPRRYQSALGLADDIERYLSNQPIFARPPSTAYQVRKLVARHKPAFAFVTTVFLLLFAFATAMTIQSARTARERDRAMAAEQTERRVSRFLVDLFKISDPTEARGNTVTAREILDTGAKTISEELQDQPLVRATLMDTMGTVYRSLGLYGKALPLLENALATRRQQLGSESIEVATSLIDLGTLLTAQGSYDAAESDFREALAIRRRILGREDEAVAASLNSLGTVRYGKGDFEEAERFFREALTMRRKLLGSQNLDVTDSLNDLAMTLTAKADMTAAEPLYREALTTRRELLGEGHPAVAQSINNLAMFLYRKKDYAGAEPLFREALAMNQKFFGEEHPEVSTTLSNLALLLSAKGDYAQAELSFRRVLEIDRKLLGEEHPYIAEDYNSLARVLTKEAKFKEAEPMFRRALEIKRKSFPENDWQIATTKSLLGACLVASKRFAEAEPLLIGAYPIIKRKFGDNHPRTQAVLKYVIELYESWGKKAQAAEYRAKLQK